MTAFGAAFLVGVDTAVMATAMRTVVTQLGGLANSARVFSVYRLARSVTVPVYGKLAGLFGRERFFISSTLIIFRDIQGIGAGGI